MENNQASSTNQIIKQVINYWADRNNAVTVFFNKYDDSVYLKEVAQNRNRAIYLLGHLIAVNDGMLPLLGLGEKIFPQFEAIFISAPDKSVPNLPSLAELKQCWEKLNATLADRFNKMNADEWLSRHMSISAEDFKLDPLRNKLNVLINRTNHQSYHLGQLYLLNV